MFRRRIKSPLLLFKLCLDVVILLLGSAAIAQASVGESSGDLILNPTQIIFKAAENNLAALLLGVLIGVYYVSTRFKFLERLDDLEENQKRIIRYLRVLGKHIKANMPDSEIPESEEDD